MISANFGSLLPDRIEPALVCGTDEGCFRFLSTNCFPLSISIFNSNRRSLARMPPSTSFVVEKRKKRQAAHFPVPMHLYVRPSLCYVVLVPEKYPCTPLFVAAIFPLLCLPLPESKARILPSCLTVKGDRSGPTWLSDPQQGCPVLEICFSS